MTLDPGTIATISVAGVGMATTAVTWAVRAYVKSQVSPVANKLETHEQTDELVHQFVREGFGDIKNRLVRIEAKMDAK